MNPKSKPKNKIAYLFIRLSGFNFLIAILLILFNLNTQAQSPDNLATVPSSASSPVLKERDLLIGYMMAPVQEQNSDEESESFLFQRFAWLTAHSFWSLQSADTNLNSSLQREERMALETEENIPNNIEVSSTPNSTISEGEKQSKTSPVQISLQEAINLAIQYNRSLENLRLTRTIQIAELAAAERKFSPRLTTSITSIVSEQSTAETNQQTTSLNANSGATLLLPTGTNISATWTGQLQNTGLNPTGVFSSNATQQDTQQIDLQLSQPLLRGGGFAVNESSVRLARIGEQQNQLTARSQVIEVVNAVITAYRSLLQTQDQLKIQEQALADAQKLLETTQILVDAGRRARADIVESQASIAERQVSLTSAQNSLAAAQQQLLSQLDIDTTIVLEAVPAEELPPLPDLDLNTLLQEAMKNQPAFLQAQLTIVTAEEAVITAENDRLWSLNLEGKYTYQLDSNALDRQDWNASLRLSQTFGDPNPNLQVKRSRTSLEQAEISLREQQEQLRIDLADRIRDVKLQFQQLELARESERLAQIRLENERERFRLGRSQLNDVIQQENALINVRSNTLSSEVGYLNSLANLETTLGRTLQTWNVLLEEK